MAKQPEINVTIMTMLRDQIAMCAMSEMLREVFADLCGKPVSFAEVARDSYAMADAMLDARAQIHVGDIIDDDPDHDSYDETTYTELP